jgi:hypothetical protein
MKRCLFIYREDRESLCDPSYGYSNYPVLEEQEFPAGTTDWEILAAARRREVKDLLEDHNTASEGKLNRVLLRVVQIAREIPL